MIGIKWIIKLCAFAQEIFQYLSMDLENQAVYLEEKSRYRMARKKYMLLDNYEKVIDLSRRLQDYKQVFIYQVKNNQIYEAMQTAEIYELYELGAPLCEKEGEFIKAAHMYSYFNPIKAASLYKQERIWDKAANCYIKAMQWLRAIECIEHISSEELKKKYYKKIEQIGEELSSKGNYEEAIKLFTRINSLEKALNLSEQIKDENTSKILYEQLARQALDQNDIQQAAYYYEKLDTSKAFSLYIKIQDIDNAARLLINQEKWEETVYLYLKNENEDKAIKIAKEHNLHALLLSYYKEKKNYEKILWIFEETSNINEGIKYFKEENMLDYVAHLAKLLPKSSETAAVLKDIGYYEQAAHYYLLEDNKEECKNCLMLSGKTPLEIENYFFIKNYPA
ncbi:MAG: hypothetical protein PWP07_2531 [Epulopiscium sp.]|jgi:hypothetical protein|uniref:hypothetical protein n=1 Tax=Defluviitalea raffinosedens TaxID=1450156 RepID=UPI00195B439E|nr:hypothetical protein [Defluviitalea raffinosedens]MBM7685321.1 hypothetical protein [Defluviitalea raffinosedens]MBZ4668190.1 hypothetical protein [Defluviitaleaceae bacterium]MDK2789286.1 hypothetical protein [Candidatus Epulonipiscium sp.]